MTGRGRLPRIAFAISAIALTALLVVRHFAIADVRRIERSYMAGRQATACATAALAPSAFQPDLDRLPDTTLGLVRQALAESKRVQSAYEQWEGVQVSLPPIDRADRAAQRALAALVALYQELLDAPQDSEPELRALGKANTLAEKELAAARRLLLTGTADGWSRRFVCSSQLGD